jgi:hypothetical protein
MERHLPSGRAPLPGFPGADGDVFWERKWGGAVRVGEGQKKVLTVKDHAGVRTVSWSLKEQDGKKRTATRTWDNMGEEEWAEVRRLLEGVEGSMELVEVMPNI